jgi:hypothetical protein
MRPIAVFVIGEHTQEDSEQAIMYLTQIFDRAVYHQ